MSYIDENWKDMLKKKFGRESGDEIWGESGDEIWKKIRKDILDEFPDTQFQPEEKNIFNVFEMLRSEIKVVILGQDPYPTDGYATGYAFAVDEIINEIPGSLKVIIKEIEKEFKIEFKEKSKKKWQTLKHWRDSGVFLLNTALTVEKKKEEDKDKKAGSHLNFWKDFTNKVIEYISENSEKYPCIWMLWGVKAKRFKGKINNGILVDSRNIDEILKEIREKKSIKDNYILEAPHPSPQNGYKFCKIDHNHNNFLYANKILIELYRKGKGIEWIQGAGSDRIF
jgi:uracil-DNA glycosylase